MESQNWSEGYAQSLPDGLYLEPMGVEHAAWVRFLLTDRICHNLAIPPIRTLEATRNFILGHGLRVTARLAIYHEEAGLVGGIGYFLFKYSGGGGNGARLSYWLGETYQGCGYATRAMLLLFNHLRSLGVVRMEAQVFRFNTPSQKLLQRSGFTCMDRAAEDHPHSMLVYTRDLA